MSEFQATWLHLYNITEDWLSQGPRLTSLICLSKTVPSFQDCPALSFQYCPVFSRLPCLFKTALSFQDCPVFSRLPCLFKTALSFQDCPVFSRLPKSKIYVLNPWTCLNSEHVWTCLNMSEHVWTSLNMSVHVWENIWSCLIMFDQLSCRSKYYQVWLKCLIVSDHVWSCLIVSELVSDHVWSCLIHC
jgi:hypothetical protein